MIKISKQQLEYVREELAYNERCWESLQEYRETGIKKPVQPRRSIPTYP